MSAIGMAGVASGLVPLLNTAASIASSNSSVIPPTPHAHSHGGSPLNQQLQQAVLSALQGAQTSGSDPNQAIQTAILNLLKQGNSTSSSTPGTQNSQSSSDSDSDSDNSVQSFMQALQSKGISPTQFRQDFISALQQMQSTPSGAKAASKIPIGLLVNTSA